VLGDEEPWESDKRRKLNPTPKPIAKKNKLISPKEKLKRAMKEKMAAEAKEARQRERELKKAEEAPSLRKRNSSKAKLEDDDKTKLRKVEIKADVPVSIPKPKRSRVQNPKDKLKKAIKETKEAEAKEERARIRALEKATREEEEKEKEKAKQVTLGAETEVRKAEERGGGASSSNSIMFLGREVFIPSRASYKLKKETLEKVSKGEGPYQFNERDAEIYREMSENDWAQWRSTMSESEKSDIKWQLTRLYKTYVWTPAKGNVQA
jgi:hypothetical protein